MTVGATVGHPRGTGYAGGVIFTRVQSRNGVSFFYHAGIKDAHSKIKVQVYIISVQSTRRLR